MRQVLQAARYCPPSLCVTRRSGCRQAKIGAAWRTIARARSGSHGSNKSRRECSAGAAALGTAEGAPGQSNGPTIKLSSCERPAWSTTSAPLQSLRCLSLAAGFLGRRGHSKSVIERTRGHQRRAARVQSQRLRGGSTRRAGASSRRVAALLADGPNATARF